jgi:isochorismate synthase
MIDALIRQNRVFAVYRLPGENRLHFIEQTGEAVCILPSIKSLNGQNGFVIVPFRISESCPIVLIEACEESIIEVPEDIGKEPATGYGLPIIGNRLPIIGYQSRFETFTRALKDKAFEKLVLSHCLTIPKKSEFSPETVFYRACKRYIRSYIYLFHTPQTGTWIGSTPEILLSGKGNEWQTVALAGTQPLMNGKLPETWDEKKQEEQQLVVDYIRNCLQSFHIKPEETAPYTVQAGELAHLKTVFRFTMPCDVRVGELLNALHPTPAVCGLPKEKAYRFINDNEGYNRRYYSGFIGRLHPEQQTDLCVNLRCMQIEDSQLSLYAGGGLLAYSDLQEEWSEIQDKLLTMYRIIN